MSENKFLHKSIEKNRKIFDMLFPKDTSADIIKNNLIVAGRSASIYHINGMLYTESMLRIHTQLLSISRESIEECCEIKELGEKFIPYTDYKTEKSVEKLCDAILGAQSVLLIEGFDEGLIIDAKRYPARSIEEPEKNKTMRGPRDGFSESIIINTSLIRRRIKSTALSFEAFDIGSETKTKVMLGYMKGKADTHCLDMIRKKLSQINVPSLTLTQEALTEELFGTTKLRRLNPFPKVRFVERPDTAASMLIEGKIMILCDTTPSAIFVPITLYDFIEETDDYYFPPLTGTYLRLVRIAITLISIFLTPLWLLVTKENISLGEQFAFLSQTPECTVPLWIQLLLIEFTVDALKIASLNTPNTIANSLGVVSGLLLGDFAISSGWFVPQSILYSSICAIANYIPTNYEIGYCFKFWRMSLIVFVQLWGIVGFLLNIIIFIAVLAANKTVDKKNYLFPFNPFNKNGFIKFFIRTNHGKENNM